MYFHGGFPSSKVAVIVPQITLRKQATSNAALFIRYGCGIINDAVRR